MKTTNPISLAAEKERVKAAFVVRDPHGSTRLQILDSDDGCYLRLSDTASALMIHLDPATARRIAKALLAAAGGTP
jgi:hypothetical protein